MMSNEARLMKKLKSIQFGIMTPELIKASSAVHVKYPHATEFPRQGFNDPAMGTTSGNAPCLSCRNDIVKCTSHLGHLTFGPEDCPTPIAHPFLIDVVHRLLSLICTCCGDFYYPIPPDVILFVKSLPSEKRLKYLFRKYGSHAIAFCGQIQRLKERRKMEEEKIKKQIEDQKKKNADIKAFKKEEKRITDLNSFSNKKKNNNNNNHNHNNNNRKKRKRNESDDENEDEFSEEEKSDNEFSEEEKSDNENDLSEEEQEEEQERDEVDESEDELDNNENDNDNNDDDSENGNKKSNKSKKRKRITSGGSSATLNKKKPKRLTVRLKKNKEKILEFDYNKVDWDQKMGCGCPKAYFDKSVSAVHATFMIPFDSKKTTASKKDWPRYDPWILFSLFRHLSPDKLDTLGLSAIFAPARALLLKYMPVLPPSQRRVREESGLNYSNSNSNANSATSVANSSVKHNGAPGHTDKKKQTTAAAMANQDKISLAIKEIITKSRRLALKMKEDAFLLSSLSSNLPKPEPSLVPEKKHEKEEKREEKKEIEQENRERDKDENKREKKESKKRKSELEKEEIKKKLDNVEINPEMLTPVFRTIVWTVMPTRKVCICTPESKRHHKEKMKYTTHSINECICGANVRYVVCTEGEIDSTCDDPEYCSCLARAGLSVSPNNNSFSLHKNETKIETKNEKKNEKSEKKNENESVAEQMVRLYREQKELEEKKDQKKQEAKKEEQNTEKGEKEEQEEKDEKKDKKKKKGASFLLSKKRTGKINKTWHHLYTELHNALILCLVGDLNRKGTGKSGSNQKNNNNGNAIGNGSGYFNATTGSSPWSSTTKNNNNALQKQQCLTSKFVGKLGLPRHNMGGRRGDRNVRTPAGPEDNQKIDELTMPLQLAECITVPEPLQLYNKAHMIDQMRNGHVQFMTPVNDDMHNTKFLDQDRISPEINTVCERTLRARDVTIVNRQPTLHMPSIQGKIILGFTNHKTNQANVCTTVPFNLDFDGDDLNLMLAMSPEAQVEVLSLMNASMQIKSQLGDSIIFCLVQNSCLAVYLMTVLNKVKLTKTQMYYYISQMGDLSFSQTIKMHYLSLLCKELPPPKWSFKNKETKNTNGNEERMDNESEKEKAQTEREKTEREKEDEKEDYWSLRQLFGLLLPPNFNFQGLDGKGINIKNSVMEDDDKKIITSAEFSKGKSNNMIHTMAHIYGGEWTVSWMTGIQRVLNTWIQDRGMTMSLEDFLPGGWEAEHQKKILRDEICERSERAAIQVQDYDLKLQNEGEQFCHGLAQRTRDHIFGIFERLELKRKSIVDQCHLDPSTVFLNSNINGKKQKQDDNIEMTRNCTQDMIDSVTKVKSTSICHVTSTVEQQHSNNSRVAPMLPYFAGPTRHSLKSKGFIEMGYCEGMDVPSAFAAAIAGRESLSNTNTEVPKIGYFQREMALNLNNLSVRHDGSVKNGNSNEIIQLRYGDDGYSPSELISIPKIFFTPFAHASSNLIEKQKTLLKIEQLLKRDRRISPIHFQKLFSFIQNTSFTPTIQKQTKIQKEKEKEENEKDKEIKKENYKKKVLEWRIKLHNDNILWLSFSLKHNFLVETLLEDALSEWNILENYKFSEQQIDLLLLKIRQYLSRALISPGEAVGSITSQSVGEPGTQTTLKQFHFSGAQSDTTSIINSLVETVQARKKAQGSMVVYLKDPFKKDEKLAWLIAEDLVERKLSEFVIKCQTFINSTFLNTKDQEWVNSNLQICNPVLKEKFQTRPCVLIEFDKKKCDRFRLNMVEICTLILKQSKSKDCFLLSSGSFQDHMSLLFTFNKENESLIKMMAYTEAAAWSKLQQHVRGVPKIQQTFLEKIVTTTINSENSENININSEKKQEIKQEEYVIITQGSNLPFLCQLSFLDFSRTTTTHVRDVYSTLGIDATYEWLIQRLSDLLKSIKTIPHIPKLIAAYMTFTGEITQLNRNGLKKRTTSPLHTIYEDSLSNMQNMSSFAQRDNITDVSAALLVGLPAPVGTGSVKYISTYKNIKKNLKKPKLENSISSTNHERNESNGSNENNENNLTDEEMARLILSQECEFLSRRNVPCKPRSGRCLQRFTPIGRSHKFLLDEHNFKTDILTLSLKNETSEIKREIKNEIATEIKTKNFEYGLETIHFIINDDQISW